MIGWAFEFTEHALDSSKVRQSLLLDGRRILVLKITKLHEKIDLLLVHRFDAFAKLVERMPIIACADGIGVGVVTVSNDAESNGLRPTTAVGWTGAGNRR